jgi:hypothetical protein
MQQHLNREILRRRALMERVLHHDGNREETAALGVPDSVPSLLKTKPGGRAPVSLQR